MIYADLPAGATVFLDARVFIHHFEPNADFGPAAFSISLAPIPIFTACQASRAMGLRNCLIRRADRAPGRCRAGAASAWWRDAPAHLCKLAREPDPSVRSYFFCV
jgi:hypothetical protein